MREITVSDFDLLVKNRASFVLHFWAEWNGYDFEQKKYFEDVLQQKTEIQYYQMNVDPEENWELCKKHKVSGPPTIVFYHHGQLAKRFVGVQTVERILKTLEELQTVVVKP